MHRAGAVAPLGGPADFADDHRLPGVGGLHRFEFAKAEVDRRLDIDTLPVWKQVDGNEIDMPHDFGILEPGGPGIA